MKTETIAKLCCPFDKAELELTPAVQDISNNLLEGFLVCSKCERIYPIVKGIPIMNPDEYRECRLEQLLIDSWKLYLKGRTLENFRLIPSAREAGGSAHSSTSAVGS